MADDPDKPLSSEEMIRRAREGPGAGSAVPPPADPPPPSIDDDEIPSLEEFEVETEEPELVVEIPEQHRNEDWGDPAYGSLPGSTPREDDGSIPAPVPTEPKPSGWRKVWRWGRWVVLAWVVFGVIGALLDDNTSIGAVDVGDCFLYEPADLITSVETVDCAESHDLELYAEVDITGFGQAYPGEEVVAEWLRARCITRFDPYVGTSFFSSEYGVFTISPSDESWEDDDRSGLCAVYIADAVGNITSSAGSARNSGR